MTAVTRRRLIVACSAGLLYCSSALAETIAIVGGTVHTMAHGVIENGDVIVRGRRIAAVGQALDIPEHAVTINASGKHVTPGLFAPYSSLGLVEIAQDGDTNEADDSTPGPDFPLGASLRTSDAYNHWSSLIPVNRAGGVTRALSAPAAGDSLFGGQAAVINLSSEEDSLTMIGVAQVLVLGQKGARRAGESRMGAWATLREIVVEAGLYHESPEDYRRSPHSERVTLSDLKALEPAIHGEQPLLVHVNGASDIRRVIRFANEHELRIIIVGGAEAWRVADELAAANIPVILDPLENLPRAFESIDATMQNAIRLNEAGVVISFLAPTHTLYLIRQRAGNAVAQGLPFKAALAAITRNPAKMYGLDAQLGSLQPGRIADVVVWTGDPLELTTWPDIVFIEGCRQDLTNRQVMLRNRYRNLTSDRLPHVYRGEQ